MNKLEKLINNVKLSITDRLLGTKAECIEVWSRSKNYDRYWNHAYPHQHFCQFHGLQVLDLEQKKIFEKSGNIYIYLLYYGWHLRLEGEAISPDIYVSLIWKKFFEHK